MKEYTLNVQNRHIVRVLLTVQQVAFTNHLIIQAELHKKKETLDNRLYLHNSVKCRSKALPQ